MESAPKTTWAVGSDGGADVGGQEAARGWQGKCGSGAPEDAHEGDRKRAVVAMYWQGEEARVRVEKPFKL